MKEISLLLHICYACIYPPCGFAHLALHLLFSPTNPQSFLLLQLICIVCTSSKEETLLLKAQQGRQIGTFFEVLINGVFIKVLRGATW